MEKFNPLETLQQKWSQGIAWSQNLLQSFLGAVIFYTCVPLPSHWPLEFERVARWSPAIGLLMGGFLGMVEGGLAQLGMPVLTRSGAIALLWLALTGGLHLDGAMDAADGLAVQDPQRRLAVMQDSATGAFGAMVAAAILTLKIAALSDLSFERGWGLMAATGWGRWGQVMAIALYPYLKPTGKGAFHKQALQWPQDCLGGLCLLLAFSGAQLALHPDRWGLVLGTAIAGSAIALLSGFWFYRQLGGHTGDTYGAVVEWTEAFVLCCLTLFQL